MGDVLSHEHEGFLRANLITIKVAETPKLAKRLDFTRGHYRFDCRH